MITLEAANLANNKYQSKNIKLEMKRLELKIKCMKSFLLFQNN